MCVSLPVKMMASTAHTDLVEQLDAVKTMCMVSSHIPELDSESEKQDDSDSSDVDVLGEGCTLAAIIITYVNEGGVLFNSWLNAGTPQKSTLWCSC